MANSAETYSWYALPFCKDTTNSAAAGVDISDSFSGDRKVATPYAFTFMKDEDMAPLCTAKLSEEDVVRTTEHHTPALPFSPAFHHSPRAFCPPTHPSPPHTPQTPTHPSPRILPQDKFSTAIEEEWYGELFVDDLPMWIYVGESSDEDFLMGHTDRSKHFLYTHLHFVIGVNGDKIVSANVSASPIYRQDITTHDPSHAGVPNLGESGGGHGHGGGASGGAFTPIEVSFTYSVQWVASTVPFEARMVVYEENPFMLQAMEIHWLSIVNSLVLVMLLTAFLAIILMRVVKNDFTRYMRADEDDEAAEEETGWKLIHGDVFRTPANLSLFTAFVGAGLHLFAVTLFLLSLSVAGTFSLARRGSVVAACIILYVLTSFVGGYESARLYKKLRGSSWVWNVMLNLVVFPAPFTATFAVLNTTAIVKSSTAALPAGTIAVVVAMFLFIAFPLGVLGGIAGHNNKEFEPPCRTSKVPRQIPDVPWYRSAPAQMFMAGFLPFSAISIELHYIFASVWGHKVRWEGESSGRVASVVAGKLGGQFFFGGDDIASIYMPLLPHSLRCTPSTASCCWRLCC